MRVKNKMVPKKASKPLKSSNFWIHALAQLKQDLGSELDRVGLAASGHTVTPVHPHHHPRHNYAI